ncbi:protein of unknown function [Enterobacter cancerogenus]|nr:protein of unknown function [Enterobacter cancerogenus]
MCYVYFILLNMLFNISKYVDANDH